MKLFKKKRRASPVHPFPFEKYEPVIRSSICTGEMTACMRDRETGKLHEVLLIRDENDLRKLTEDIGVDSRDIRTIY